MDTSVVSPKLKKSSPSHQTFAQQQVITEEFGRKRSSSNSRPAKNKFPSRRGNDASEAYQRPADTYNAKQQTQESHEFHNDRKKTSGPEVSQQKPKDTV
ncbi:hypothetical protein B9Z55_012238 [Caenorhabditis nigoni]|uniref:Uncharacterized protein n=1 Tax=Caenorhabditis nigoni TaxID=1611254 RepID=A0A2G5TXA0_9PELO|nr:hypothetical protein B9Z55_012238 [Caenorhabditis nigoni]